jgi:hypothetical protein
MECEHCGGAMMAETVIKLQQGLFGFRESRSRGAYCFTCKIGVQVASHLAAPVQPRTVVVRAYRAARRLLTKPPRTKLFRSGNFDTDSIRLGNPLSLVR